MSIPNASPSPADTAGLATTAGKPRDVKGRVRRALFGDSGLIPDPWDTVNRHLCGRTAPPGSRVWKSDAVRSLPFGEWKESSS